LNLNPILSQASEWMGVIAVAMLAGVSARFFRRPLVFQYGTRELTFSFSLYALVLALSILLYLFLRPPLFVRDTAPIPLARLILAAVSLLPFVIALIARGQPVRAIGWGGLTLRPSLLMGVSLGLLALFLRGKVFSILNGIAPPQANALLFFLLLALIEETIFRGYIQLRLVSAWGQWSGILAAALLYSLWQIPRMMVQPQATESVVLHLGLAFVQGIILGYLMQRTGNVAAPGLYRGISEWLQVLA
jgi:membrane protease YdiL (CAAX protease family)